MKLLVKMILTVGSYHELFVKIKEVFTNGSKVYIGPYTLLYVRSREDMSLLTISSSSSSSSLSLLPLS